MRGAASRSTIRRGGFGAAALFLAACGGGGATSPTAVPRADAPGTTTLVRGVVVGTVEGAPVAGATVTVAGATATTDAAGRFELAVAATGVVPVRVEGAGHVTRRSFLRVGGAEPRIDAIEPAPLWSLDFYRELCRDGAGGGTLKPLNPWTVEPSFYVDRRPESGTGRPIPDAAVETVLEAIGTVVPLLTGGRLTGERVTVGTEPPADGTAGTVVVRWSPVEVAEVGGPAAGITRGVGGNASVVVLRTIEDTESIFHELGHVLGLYHPLGGLRPSLMLGPGRSERPHFTEWDVHHARILYARPPGNTDIDDDPPGFVINDPGALGASASSAQKTVMVCR